MERRYVLDTILSLDGGKPASMILRSPPQRVRSLLNHHPRTSLDLRLFAQVELNTLRTRAQNAITSVSADSIAERDDRISQIVQGTTVDLSLWVTEWQDLVIRHCRDAAECSVMQLNLRIQHVWALVALHLRALSASGIENVAIMTEKQCSLALAAKVCNLKYVVMPQLLY